MNKSVKFIFVCDANVNKHVVEMYALTHFYIHLWSVYWEINGRNVTLFAYLLVTFIIVNDKYYCARN